MADQTFFVRIKGKVTGPYDVASLQKLVRRGVLSRMHQISSDQRSWSRADEFEDLFPAAVAEATPGATAPGARVAAPPAPRGNLYYYAQNGQSSEPVTMEIIVSLAQSGAIQPGDLVWAEGATHSQRAGEIPPLAKVFSAKRPEGSLRTAPAASQALHAVSPEAAALAPGALSRTATLSRVIGIVSGCMLLLFLNLPATAFDDRTIWWWNVLKMPSTGALGVLVIFTLCAGIATVAVAAVARGLARGLVFAGIGIGSFVLIVVTGLTVMGDNSDSVLTIAMVFTFALPFLAAALTSVCYFRDLVPEVKMGSILQSIFGGALTVSVLILVIVGMVSNPISMGDFNSPGQPLPGWMVMSTILLIIGLLASLAAGVMGVVGIKGRFSEALNVTTLAIAAASMLLPFVAMMVVAEGVGEKTGLVVFMAFRIIVIAVAFLALMAVGLAETLVAAASARRIGR